jgi:hypothetical protein
MHSAETAMQPHQRNGSAQVLVETLHALSFKRCSMLCGHCHSCGGIEGLSGLEHGVHDDRKLSCDSHSSSFETDPLPKLSPHVRKELCTELRMRMTDAAS